MSAAILNAYNKAYIYFVCLVAALGGLMFGFDLGVITGVVPYIEHQFSRSGFSLGFVVAIFELGAMVGALGTSRVANLYGRKKAMLYCAVLLCITSVGVAYANGSVQLSIWRFIQGISVGAASVISPMYIAEVAPAKARGRLVSLNQLTIILGILLASLVNFYFGDNNLESENWRLMLLAGLIPSTIFLVLIFLIPESPRWLISNTSKRDKAIKTLNKIYKNQESIAFAEEIEQLENKMVNEEKVPLTTLVNKAFLPILLIAFGVAFLQQFCGINNVIPFMQKIFVMAGLELQDGLLNAVFIQLVFVAFTFLAILLVDRIGRKILMQVGTLLMAGFLLLLGLVFYFEGSGMLILIFLMLYIATFAFTLGPVVWVLISEMFPGKIRSRAISLSSAVLWLSTFLVVLISPYLLSIGAVFNFVLFGILNIIGFIFCTKYLPETKGKSLEEMEDLWEKRLNR